MSYLTDLTFKTWNEKKGEKRRDEGEETHS